MHEHRPNCLEGPIRGTNAWWRGLGLRSEPASAPAEATNTNALKAEDVAIRKELVERVRREIDAGTYDNLDKWQAALDRLLQGLDRD